MKCPKCEIIIFSNSLNADKFQYAEQIKTAASVMEAAVIFVMLGQNVVILKSSKRVVQMGQTRPQRVV